MERRQVLARKYTNNGTYFIGVFPVKCRVIEQSPDLWQLACTVAGRLNREPLFHYLRVVLESLIEVGQSLAPFSRVIGIDQSTQCTHAIRHVIGFPELLQSQIAPSIVIDHQQPLQRGVSHATAGNGLWGNLIGSDRRVAVITGNELLTLSLIHISEPTRRTPIS